MGFWQKWLYSKFFVSNEWFFDRICCIFDSIDCIFNSAVSIFNNNGCISDISGSNFDRNAKILNMTVVQLAGLRNILLKYLKIPHNYLWIFERKNFNFPFKLQMSLIQIKWRKYWDIITVYLKKLLHVFFYILNCFILVKDPFCCCWLDIWIM